MLCIRLYLGVAMNDLSISYHVKLSPHTVDTALLGEPPLFCHVLLSVLGHFRAASPAHHLNTLALPFTPTPSLRMPPNVWGKKKKATIAGCGVVKRNSAAMETEAADWGGENSGDGFRANAMRGVRADVREEKAGVSRAVGDATKRLGDDPKNT